MKCIVTTTINPPTEATLKFAGLCGKEWDRLIVVGDTKTPHKEYENLPGVEYLHPDQQQICYPELSTLIGWKTIQRRNIGFVYAYDKGADIVATVDDDNIPYSSWKDSCLVDKERNYEVYENAGNPILDPLSVGHLNDLGIWHRGYPSNYISSRKPVFAGFESVVPDIQAMLWDGDPDVDAICRLTQQPNVRINPFYPFKAKGLTVFNSQNTILSRRVLPYYMVLPFCGRMDDIWGGYLLQRVFPHAFQRSLNIVFSNATVYQARNPHDLIKDMQAEMIGYEHNWKFCHESLPMLCENVIPAKTLEAYRAYTEAFGLDPIL